MPIARQVSMVWVNDANGMIADSYLWMVWRMVSSGKGDVRQGHRVTVTVSGSTAGHTGRKAGTTTACCYGRHSGRSCSCCRRCSHRDRRHGCSGGRMKVCRTLAMSQRPTTARLGSNDYRLRYAGRYPDHIGQPACHARHGLVRGFAVTGNEGTTRTHDSVPAARAMIDELTAMAGLRW